LAVGLGLRADGRRRAGRGGAAAGPDRRRLGGRLLLDRLADADRAAGLLRRRPAGPAHAEPGAGDRGCGGGGPARERGPAAGAAEDRPSIEAELRQLLDDAAAEPGAIATRDIFCARRTGRRTWAALPPEAGSHRVRDVLRALDHERALWAAAEPHATRVHALT